MNTQRIAFIFCVFLFCLLFSGCRTGQVFGPTVTPTSTVTPTPTSTKTLIPTITAIPKPSATFTPEATATPEIEAKICTSENFLDYEIPEESLFDGTYMEALSKTLTTPFDLTKTIDVPLWANGQVIIYYPKRAPFNRSQKDTWPFQTYLTGHVNYEGNDYAVIPVKFENPTGKDTIVVSLYKFKPYESTDQQKKERIKLWEDEMNLTPLVYPREDPTDPLIIKTIAKYPDWMDRIKRFVNNNKFNTKNQDIAAIDGMVFLTIIEPNSWTR